MNGAAVGSDPPLPARYREQGYVILRGLLDEETIRAMRPVADQLRELAHRQRGPQAQRTDPLDRYVDEVDLAPFSDYAEDAVVRAALADVVGPGHRPSGLDGTTVLVEPLDHPWNLGWHRDVVAVVPAAARDDRLRGFLERFWHELELFHQMSVALHPDSCFWYVAGSHRRFDDLEGEVETLGRPDLRAPDPGADPAAFEAGLTAHCREMPGAVQIHLRPGDAVVYHQLGWHVGNYGTERPRATLHHLLESDASRTFEAASERARRDAIRRYRARRLLREPWSMRRRRR